MQWFSSFDLRGAYNQEGVKSSSRPCLNFQDMEGRHYRKTRLPFRVNQAPAQFNSIMIKMFAGLKNQINIRYYLDDIILFETAPEPQLKSIDLTLSTFISNGLRRSVEKTHLLMNVI